MKKQKIFGALATLFTLVAATVASSACWYYFYQPQEPESLQDR